MKSEKELVAARLDVDLLKYIKDRAKKENRTFSNMIETMLWGICISDESKK